MFVARCSRALVVAAAAALWSAPSAENAPRLPPSAEQAIEEISAGELRAHVGALAADDMAGRGVGQDGNRKAVQYVADALRQARVAPAGAGYLQPVELYQPSLGSNARLTIASRGKPIADLAPGSDFYPLPESGAEPVSGPIVFAGHGIAAPTLGYDDYSGRNVRGAIVLVRDDVPEALNRRPGLTGDERAALATIDRKVADARARGAVGVIVIRQGLVDASVAWAPPASVRQADYRLHADVVAAPAVAIVSTAAADPARRALDERVPLSATLVPDLTIRRVTVHNVVCVAGPASQPPEEMIVVGAHLDHDGVDEQGRIYNGADDNASGTAAVIAMAAAFARAADAGGRPRRRVVFALWNAEERGSLGARDYLRAPVPPGRVIANLNIDMVGRGEDVPDPGDPRFHGFRRTTARVNANVVHTLGYSFSPDLAALAGRANDTIGLTIKREYDEGAQDLLRRSDHWPFLQRGIPALFFTTGLHPDYHTPDDDTDRIDFAKLERIAELVGRLAWMVADGEPPRFRKPR